jgi:hypothetical protein
MGSNASDSDELAVPEFSSDEEVEPSGAAAASSPTAAPPGHDDLPRMLLALGVQAAKGPEKDAAAPPQRVVCELDAAYTVERVHTAQLSVADFRRRCRDGRCPLIITGLAQHLAPATGGLSTAALRAALPAEMGVPVRGRGVSSAGSFFDSLGRGEHVYLADVPVPRHFPWLLQLFHVPRYFTHCFTHRTRTRLSLVFDTPALFVGNAGTGSPLHVDQMCSNFWMFLAEGETRE